MTPTWREVRQFCRRQGYQETRTDHFHYVKVLPDRSTSGTMVSMGVDGEQVPSQMWRLVWSRQLHLASEDEFWKGLDGGDVRYAIPPVAEPPQPLPAYLLTFLRNTQHMREEQISGLTREQAQEILDTYYGGELRDP